MMIENIRSLSFLKEPSLEIFKQQNMLESEVLHSDKTNQNSLFF